MSIMLGKMEKKHMEKGDGQRIRLLLKDRASIGATLKKQLPENLEDRQHSIYAIQRCAEACGEHLGDVAHIFVYYNGSDKTSMKRANFVATAKPGGMGTDKKAARAVVASMFVLASVWKKPFTNGDWQFSGPSKFSQHRLSHKHAIQESMSNSMKGGVNARREDAAERLYAAMSNEVA